MGPAAVGIPPHDLAAIVDPVGGGDRSTGEIDRGEATAGVEETMPGSVAKSVLSEIASSKSVKRDVWARPPHQTSRK